MQGGLGEGPGWVWTLQSACPECGPGVKSCSSRTLFPTPGAGVGVRDWLETMGSRGVGREHRVTLVPEAAWEKPR